jgi:hypothetical protein
MKSPATALPIAPQLGGKNHWKVLDKACQFRPVPLKNMTNIGNN